MVQTYWEHAGQAVRYAALAGALKKLPDVAGQNRLAIAPERV
jgi:Holliday junction resolvase